ncbi:Nramp family divalent metal transporter [Parvularcula maris]|uniref:Nramp family divalent metal transporter n=1 Tax=Parvularcula maris TaxID=2965077 RepID=A0A9X2LD40_9PROT|nr:Nramp family divalent metal transporter [Parvularcula maris]MCQ8186337.1 Nramp family divalent metal transporter [Parvularcula maris]
MEAQKRRGGFGPGMLVAAAFVGPGTVTTATLAGQTFGMALLWALVFATLAAVVLQDMAARLGAGGGRGLGEALRLSLRTPMLRYTALALVSIAILLGNAAYQGGNLAGAALGAEATGVTIGRRLVVVLIAVLAASVLLPGRYRLLEGVLVGIVALMSAAFLLALALARPDPAALFAGLRPQLPEGSLLTVLALLGTTIVPYNLFLHAAAAKERWPGGGSVPAARRDNVAAILLGGLVSAAILIVAASSGNGEGQTGLADALRESFGGLSRYVMAAGLLAAGLSSAVTAPMAAGFVAGELFASSEAERVRYFRLASLTVLLTGTVIAALGLRPEALILLAQAANGLLLPVVAVFLLALMNRSDLLGSHRNRLWSNIAGGLVVLTALFLGLRGLLRAFGLWP